MHGFSEGKLTIKDNFLIVKKYYPYSFWMIYHIIMLLRANIVDTLKWLLPARLVWRIIALKKMLKFS
jgi:hypothetical protein